MPPVLIWMIGALGGAAVAVVIAREMRRINAELDRMTRPIRTGDPIGKLERDPDTGIYRPR